MFLCVAGLVIVGCDQGLLDYFIVQVSYSRFRKTMLTQCKIVFKVIILDIFTPKHLDHRQKIGKKREEEGETASKGKHHCR